MTEEKRPQFGNRFLDNADNVFEHNAWDNVEWSDEQENEAKQKVQEQLKNSASSEERDKYVNGTDHYWNEFYKQHESKFYQDRNWLLTEFPELFPQYTQSSDGCSSADASISAAAETLTTVAKDLVNEEDTLSILSSKKESATEHLPTQNTAQNSKDDAHIATPNTPEEVTESTYMNSKPFRVFEVGCGVGNTAFQVLKINNDPGLFVYCCDLSETAISLVKNSPSYDSSRCEAFVCDVSDELSHVPIPDESLDIIVLIFILSAVPPDRVEYTVQRLVSLLKPGGLILLRDYGRYDLAQLRFKPQRCLSENFYARGEGTLVYFFTQEELRTLFTSAGLTEVQNTVDRRLTVNRRQRQTMYRVWMQCKYQKPPTSHDT